MSGTPVAVKFNTSGATTSTSAPITTATGSTFFVVISEALNQPGVQIPTDNKGNTYLLLGAVQDANTQIRVYAVQNGIGGAGHTATVTWTSPSDASLWFIECPSVAAASIDVGTVGASGASGPSPYNITSGSPAVETDLFLSFCSGAWNNYTAAPSGFTDLSVETNNGLYWTGGVAYRAVTAPSAAVTAAWTISSASSAARVIVGLKPAAGGAGIDGAGQIASAEAVGSPGIAAGVTPAGIATGEVFGSASVGAGIAVAGIASAEAVGAPVVGVNGIVAVGIPSAEAFGQPAVSARIVAAGIVSAEAFGLPTVGDPTPEPTRPGGFEMGGRRIREVYFKPLLQRILEARAPKVKPAKERARKRAKVIEVQAARLAFEDGAEDRFRALMQQWMAQRPVIPQEPGLDAQQLFMAQVAFRIQQMQAEEQARARIAAQIDEEEALIALLLV